MNIAFLGWGLFFAGMLSLLEVGYVQVCKLEYIYETGDTCERAVLIILKRIPHT